MIIWLWLYSSTLDKPTMNTKSFVKLNIYGQISCKWIKLYIMFGTSGIINSMSNSCVFNMSTNWSIVCWSLGTAWSGIYYRQCSNNEWYISQGNVATLSMSIVNVYTCVVVNSSSCQQLNNSENRLEFGKVIAKIQLHLFSETQCIYLFICLLKRH